MTIDAIRESLHLIAGVLIWPVMSALLLLSLATLMSAGGFLREAYDRLLRARRAAFHAAQRELDQVEHTAGTSSLELRLEEVLQRTSSAAGATCAAPAWPCASARPSV
jgi:hypothetical protein